MFYKFSSLIILSIIKYVNIAEVDVQEEIKRDRHCGRLAARNIIWVHRSKYDRGRSEFSWTPHSSLSEIDKILHLEMHIMIPLNFMLS